MKNLFLNEPRTILVCLLILFALIGNAQTDNLDQNRQKIVTDSETHFPTVATAEKVAAIELSPLADKDQIILYVGNLSAGAAQTPLPKIVLGQEEFGAQEDILTLEAIVVAPVD